MFRFSQSKHPNFLKVYYSAQDLLNDIPIIKRRRLLRRYLKVLKYFSFGLIFFFLSLAIIFGGEALIVKQVYVEALAGKKNLERSVESVKTEKFLEAIESAQIAQNDFHASLIDLEKARQNLVVSRVPVLRGQFESAGHLLSAAEILAKTVERGASLADDMEGLLGEGKKLSFSKFTPEERERILKRIYISGPELIFIKDDLETALINLEQIDARGLLFPFSDKIIELKTKIKTGEKLLAEIIPLSKIMPRLAGYPDKTAYLIVLQNNDELRPTGGFIGTYGILELRAGDITRLDTHDIYHMDMPVKDKIDVVPPEPIRKYLNDKWYMRDANWSPDWPTSAEKILWFYKMEDGLLPPKDQINNFKGEFNGVIAITPDLVTDLLKIIGSVNIGGQEYDSDNFTDILQYKVEKGYVQLGVPSWQRKEVISDIVKELKIKLFDLPSDRWGEILEVFGNSATKKDVIVYMKDRELENEIKDRGWGGEIRKNDKDYLMVVDANLGALKTDAVIKRNIDYKVEQRADGLFAKLTLNYAHRGEKNWKIDKYKTYTRIYVPYGSRLISVNGGRDKADTGNESGKTYFGIFLTVDPGKITNFYLEYELPERLAFQGQYELYAQKQPGKYVEDLVVDLSLGKGVKSYSPTGFYVDKKEDGAIKWETDLNNDKVFKINF